MAARLEELSKNVFLIHDVLTPQECQDYIDMSEGEGYDAAPITTSMGFVHRPDIRNNTRVMVDDVDRAADLWDRIAEHLPGRWYTIRMGSAVQLGQWEPCGLNERLRFYRYHPGQKFALHRDGYYARPNGEQSVLTALFFLNEGFEGGATQIIEPTEPARVVPKTGAALLFEHGLLHEGQEVTDGVKYILRSDVMYRPLLQQ